MQEISVIPLIPVPVPVHVADLILSNMRFYDLTYFHIDNFDIDKLVRKVM